MDGDGPFLWLTQRGPPSGFWHLPPGGMCLSAFLFVRRGRKILLGKYADDPAWEELAGLDPDRRRTHGSRWTIPASHLKYGEDPRAAAERIGREILRMTSLSYSEPRVEVDLYEPRRFPGPPHFDMWFLIDAVPKDAGDIERPPWYADLTWQDPRTLPPSEYARDHQDVVARWLTRRESPSALPPSEP